MVLAMQMLPKVEAHQSYRGGSDGLKRITQEGLHYRACIEHRDVRSIL